MCLLTLFLGRKRPEMFIKKSIYQNKRKDIALLQVLSTSFGMLGRVVHKGFRSAIY